MKKKKKILQWLLPDLNKKPLWRSTAPSPPIPKALLAFLTSQLFFPSPCPTYPSSWVSAFASSPLAVL